MQVSLVLQRLFIMPNVFITLQSTDIIFDAILPEWALAELCKELNVTRAEAVQVIKNQNIAIIEAEKSDQNNFLYFASPLNHFHTANLFKQIKENKTNQAVHNFVKYPKFNSLDEPDSI